MKKNLSEKKKQKRKKEKTLNMTEGALYITSIFMNRFSSNRLNFVLLNLYSEQGNKFVSRGVVNKVSYE